MNDEIAISTRGQLCGSEELRRQSLDWLSQFEGNLTHFVTLTFDSAKIWAYINGCDKTIALHDPVMIDLYKASMGKFGRYLNHGLFGNSSRRFGQRLLLIPVLEGLSRGRNPHYHCVMGVESNRSEVLEQRVVDAWKRVPFSGHQIDVQAYRDHGCLSYTTKETKYLDRESIDFDNVLLPV